MIVFLEPLFNRTSSLHRSRSPPSHPHSKVSDGSARAALHGPTPRLWPAERCLAAALNVHRSGHRVVLPRQQHSRSLVMGRPISAVFVAPAHRADHVVLRGCDIVRRTQGETLQARRGGHGVCGRCLHGLFSPCFFSAQSNHVAHTLWDGSLAQEADHGLASPERACCLHRAVVSK